MIIAFGSETSVLSYLVAPSGKVRDSCFGCQRGRSERVSRGVEQEEQSLGERRRRECGKESYEAVSTGRIEGIGVQAIDGEEEACGNPAVMGPECGEIIREISPEDERIAKSVDQKRAVDEGRELSKTKWPYKGIEVTHDGTDE
jgi:hypothetical protein